MFNSIKNILFSTKLTAVLLFVFAFAIGYATILENDYGTAASKALIFNTKWFEIILILLAINLFGNIFKYKLLKKAKLASLTFHLAFIIIIIGAGITRYISYEGYMHIREGEKSNTFISADAYLQVKVDNQKIQYTFDKKLYLNPRYNSKFSHEFDFEGKKIKIAYKDFIANAIDTVVDDNKGTDIIEIVTVGRGGRFSRYIESGRTVFFGNIPVAFNDASFVEAIKILNTDSGLTVNSPYEMKYLSMDDRSEGLIKKDSTQPFKNRRLYSVDNVQMVFKTIHHNAVVKQVSAPKNNPNGEDDLVITVNCNEKSKDIMLFGQAGIQPKNAMFQIEGINFTLGYGSKNYTLPFSLMLKDFKLEKYPGSMSPSSFESEVTLTDERDGGTHFDHRIYMNNVLDYDGYRFFQSSYDSDEKGTVLSVNHDYWGTSITYIGYFFLFLGMIITLMMKKSRFTNLRKNIKKLRAKREVAIVLMLLFTTFSGNLLAQDKASTNDFIIPKAHADKFAKILIQDQSGRIKPIQTLASELLRKVARKENYNGQSPTQVLLGMMYDPMKWQAEPMIKIRNPELEEQLGAKDHHVSFMSFFDEKFNYAISDEVSEAKRKKPAEQSKYDKELVKVDERVNICYMIFQGSLLRIFPKENDANHNWYSSREYQNFEHEDSVFVKSFFALYFNAIEESFKTNNWEKADTTLSYLDQYQQKFGGKVLISQTKVKTEIFYNKVNIFKKLFMYYSLVGLLMLFFLFAEIFSVKKWKKLVVRILTYTLFVLFIFHSSGLIARWYISEHAPWSNGYESMIYIAWVTLLAGFIFSKSSKMTIAATAILSSLILMVAHLNWLDPEITPLVPVLKSYWLMIHVAVITGSYGFLGLGAILGFMNLLLMIFMTNSNKDRIKTTLKELTYITEMTLIVGLFMAAIGTFLGGVWANESWGRYWGWDPKETWALVIVLVYAIILHLRFIPKASGKFLFNLVAVLGFASVLMTYFGVNYYLSGLHSYAKGDPVPIPTFVPITILVILLTATVAYFRNKKYSKN